MNNTADIIYFSPIQAQQPFTTLTLVTVTIQWFIPMSIVLVGRTTLLTALRKCSQALPMNSTAHVRMLQE